MTAAENELLPAVIETIHTLTGATKVASDNDFYDAGVTSVMALPLLMELEGRFGVSIPDENFMSARTARALASLIQELQTQP